MTKTLKPFGPERWFAQARDAAETGTSKSEMSRRARERREVTHPPRQLNLSMRKGS
jgi:hypothetical protein